MGQLYRFGIFTQPGHTALLQSLILGTSRELLEDSVTLCDTLSPPDFILNSVLGHSSGDIYARLEETMRNSEVTKQGRPEYWKELAGYYSKSKL